MNVLKGIALVVGISSLFAVLVWIAGAFTGAGHGCYFLLETVVAPFFGAGVFATVGALGFWPLVSVLLALRRFLISRIAATLALVIHYVGVVAVMSRPGWDDGIAKSWSYFPGAVAAFFGAYIASQVFMWLLIARKQSAD